MERLSKANSLGPSKLDLTLYELSQYEHNVKCTQAELLLNLQRALEQALKTTKASPVALPKNEDFRGADLVIDIDSADEFEWNPQTAHEELDMVRIRLTMQTYSAAMSELLLQTCIPFLQPDSSMIEAVQRKDVIVQILMTRARLVHVLGSSSHEHPVKHFNPPQPSVLHYTAKVSLTEAYVRGIAVQAICGQWWVPIGDENTHKGLPICPECDEEVPFTQFVRSILR